MRFWAAVFLLHHASCQGKAEHTGCFVSLWENVEQYCEGCLLACVHDLESPLRLFMLGVLPCVQVQTEAP